jgi:ABC-type multidrug transport system permease subunit
MSAQGTLDLELMSRAPMFSIMLGKSLAAFVFYGLIGVACFFVAILIGGSGVEVGNPPALVLSLLVGALAVIAMAFIFAPFTFVVGGQSGFFNAIFPIGIILSGFVQPAALLPPVFQFFARAMPTSWAMDALLLALRGAGWDSIAWRWAAALALCVATYGFAGWLFLKAEAQVRQQGATE